MAKKTIEVPPVQVDTVQPTYLSTYKRVNPPKKERKPSVIKFPPSVQTALSLSGFPISNITTISGFSDTGKTTLLLHGIIEAQRMGILPIILLTENKFNWLRAKTMGMDCHEVDVVDETTGEVSKMWDGFFIMKNDFYHTEELYQFMLDRILDTRPDKKGNIVLPTNICFFVDSLNKLVCSKSSEKINDGEADLPMHNAKSHKIGLGYRVEPLITQSKFEEFPYTASMVAILRGYSGSDTPILKDGGGHTMYYDVALKILCGGKLAPSTQELTKDILGKTRKIGAKTKIRVIKNHVMGQTSEGEIYNCIHGLMSKEEYDTYITENLSKIREYYKTFDILNNQKIEDE